MQYLLPLNVRENIINDLFKKIVNVEEKEFASKLYMSFKNIKEMYSNKMFIGSHGTDHLYLEHINKNDQEKEIKNSISFFSKLGIDKNNLSMVYPHGSYNKITLDLLNKYKIKFAFTTKPGSITNRNITNKYLLPRYDTNDFKYMIKQ